VAPAELRDNPHPATDRMTVLVVEDDVLTRLVAAEELRSVGLSVVEAANADEALAVLQSPVAVALVFTDIHMPGSMDGLTLARSVRSTHPDLKIVATSGDAPALPSPAFDAFVAKPYDTAEVARQIKDLLAGAKP
jgi:two-component system, response regulator PdtaR